MTTTRSTLLKRIKDRSDVEAWQEFHKLYAPFMYRYARGRGLSRQDAEEVRDQCLEIVARKIASFDYVKARGGFKNWLRRIVTRRVIDLIRKRREKTAGTDQLRALRASELQPDEVWEQEWKREHLKYCVNRVRNLVSEQSFRAFRLLVFEGYTVADVCSRLSLNANQVYKAKSRVLQHVREMLTEVGVESVV